MLESEPALRLQDYKLTTSNCDRLCRQWSVLPQSSASVPFVGFRKMWVVAPEAMVNRRTTNTFGSDFVQEATIQCRP